MTKTKDVDIIKAEALMQAIDKGRINVFVGGVPSKTYLVIDEELLKKPVLSLIRHEPVLPSTR